jgi:hypothetical protein
MAEAAKVISSKVMRKGTVPTLPTPILQAVMSLAPKSIVHAVSGIRTVVGQPRAKRAVLTERILVRELRSSNWRKSVGV